MTLPITQRGRGSERPPLTPEVVGYKLPQTASSPEAAEYAVVRLQEELVGRRFDQEYVTSMLQKFKNWAESVAHFNESHASGLNQRASEASRQLDSGARYQGHFAVSDAGEYQRVWLSEAGDVLPQEIVDALDAQVDASMASRGVRLHNGKFIETDVDGHEVQANPDKARDILQNRVKHDLEQRGVSLGDVHLHDYQQQAQKAAAEKTVATHAQPQADIVQEPQPEPSPSPAQGPA